MAYTDFTTLQLKDKFGVEQKYRTHIFAHLPPRAPSDWLHNALERGVGFALDQDSEKARSDFIMAPVFLELKHQAQSRISIFSGVEFNVDRKLGLSGFCDFLISRSPYQAALEAPVVVAVEAKRQDFKKGITQCTAEMIAARIYNEQRGQAVNEIYGCVTTGDVWRFLRLRENTVEIETASFDIVNDLEQIFGILWAMAVGEV